MPVDDDSEPGAASTGQAGLSGFQARKESALGKRDKSNAGRIDPRAVDICAAINDRSEYFTTSSCAGRCLLYRGDGIKSHHHFAAAGYSQEESTLDAPPVNDASTNNEAETHGLGFFERFRVSHDVVHEPARYFNLSTLDPNDAQYDPTGGGDPVRSVGQFDHMQLQKQVGGGQAEGWADAVAQLPTHLAKSAGVAREGAIWLRFEPFILHVMCRSLSAASALMAAARPSFKNVGLTSFKHGYGRYIVAIWGDEGLDMPLTAPDDPSIMFFAGREDWLAKLVNERHKRNWAKMERFVDEVRRMPPAVDDVDGWSASVPSSIHDINDTLATGSTPKRFEVVGDVAILNNVPPGHHRTRYGSMSARRYRC
eukprot:TRINITY_DN1313_c1_g1_i1.p1 TRINITY_DN1313_c1_g1~~TRINITY_DN1313_c1_g1_i1.p1  ORF type:complete len:368 (+),score=53.50 TRINITY_DN1313_c1_g1_i1:114-1217(+)